MLQSSPLLLPYADVLYAHDTKTNLHGTLSYGAWWVMRSLAVPVTCWFPSIYPAVQANVIVR